MKAIGLLLTPLLLSACLGGTPEEGASSSQRDSDDSGGLSIRFAEVADAVGLGVLPASGPTYGSSFVDFDLDGWPDLLVGRHKRHPRLFQNLEGRFDLLSIPGLDEPAPGRKIYDLHACAWGEASGDLLPDLYCVSGAQDGAGQGPNRLFLQENAVDFVLDTPSALEDLFGRGRTTNWLDVDGDNDLDIYVANEIREGVPSGLFINSNGRFTRVDDSVLTDEFPVRSTSWADWTNDGDPDLMISGHGYRATRAFVGEDGAGFKEINVPGITGRAWLSAAFADFDNDGWEDVVMVAEDRATVFRNIDGRLRKHQALGNVRGGRMAVLADVDNDGLLDMLLIQGSTGDPPPPNATNHPNILFMQRGGKFHKAELDTPDVVRGPREGNSESAAAADFDRDGRVDFFVAHGYLDVGGPFQLLRNESVSNNSYITVHLRGPKGNPFGFGARVEVRTEEMVIRRSVTDGFTFRNQSAPGILYVGVGRARSADVTVLWSDGSKSCGDFRSGQAVVVSFGSGC